jgi:hypothetical protein
LRRPPAGTSTQPTEKVERECRPKLPPIQATLGKELERVPQVVTIGQRGVRAAARSEDVRQEPIHRDHGQVAAIDESDTGDDAVRLLDRYPHLASTAPLRRVRLLARRVHIRKNSATAAAWSRVRNS